MKERAEKLLEEFDVRGGGAETYAAALSGGNQQKVAVAREIASNPKVLVAHQPTRGLDVGAIEFVHRRLIAERDNGRAVLLVSLEYEEVRALADRILVIYEGKIVGEFPPDASEEELGMAMTGGKSAAVRGGDVSLLEEELQAEAEESTGAAATSPAALTAFRRGVSGVAVPIITAVIAFIGGGLIVLATGHDPLTTYHRSSTGPASTGCSRGSPAPSARPPPGTCSRRCSRPHL